jgi:hypothetical protein
LALTAGGSMEKRSQAKKYLLDSSNGLIPDQEFICHWVSWKNGRKKEKIFCQLSK